MSGNDNEQRLETTESQQRMVMVIKNSDKPIKTTVFSKASIMTRLTMVTVALPWLRQDGATGYLGKAGRSPEIHDDHGDVPHQGTQGDQVEVTGDFLAPVKVETAR